MATLHQPRPSAPEPPRESCPVILLFPGSDPVSDPDTSLAAIALDFLALGATPEEIRSLSSVNPQDQGLARDLGRMAAEMELQLTRGRHPRRPRLAAAL